MTWEAHTAVRVMKNPDSSWSQHGKTCKVHPVFAAEAVTEAMTICYTGQSISGGVFYPQPSKESSSINFTGLGYLEMNLISQKGS